MPKLDLKYEERELARLKSLMADPRYWKTNDPAFVEEVQEGFRALYDDKPKGARASAGQAANSMGVNGSVHAQDTEVAHVTPGEIVIPVSAQSPELMQILYGELGNDLLQFTVGLGFERRNPTSGLPAFADTSFWEDFYNRATFWHFEDRDALNKPLPNSEDDAKRRGFFRYPASQSEFHENERRTPEKKYGHKRGREVVFDGDTGKVENNPRYRGTYNYVVPRQEPRDGMADEMDDLGRKVGHFVTDVLPWGIAGNERGAHDNWQGLEYLRKKLWE